MIFSPVFVDFSWQEEFQAATNLLSNVLLRDEINRNGDFTEGESSSVLQDLNESSNCTQAISNESNMQSCNGEDISLVSEPQEQIESSSSNNTQTSNKGGTLNMRDKPFAGPSISSGAGPTLTKEPQQLCVSSEIQSDSDDELEQFVLQPKGRRQQNIKLWLLYWSLNMVDQVGVSPYLFAKDPHLSQSVRGGHVTCDFDEFHLPNGNLENWFSQESPQQWH